MAENGKHSGGMIRIIHGVGHGAFYTETFSDMSSVVYDCGTNGRRKDLEKIIDDFLRFSDTIPVLFVSHFDKDHINGIEYLLNKNSAVKRLIIPYYSEEEKCIMLVAHLLTGGTINDFTYRFIENTRGVLDSINNNNSGNEPVELVDFLFLQQCCSSPVSAASVFHHCLLLTRGFPALSSPTGPPAPPQLPCISLCCAPCSITATVQPLLLCSAT
jgi:hypothetical protein